MQGLRGIIGTVLTMAPPISVPPDKLIMDIIFYQYSQKYQFQASLFITSPVVAKILNEVKS